MSDRAGASRSIASAVAAVFALLAFVVAIVAGVASGGDAESSLLHAIVALACCWPLGWIAAKVVEQQLGGALIDPPGAPGSGAPNESVPSALPIAEASARMRDTIAPGGPEENPTGRQELRSRSRPG